MAALSDSLPPDLFFGAVKNRQRTRPEFVRIPHIEIRRPHHNFSAATPHEAAAENIRVKRADEDADAPERQACSHQAFAGFHHYPGWARCGPRAVDEPVDDFLQFGCVHGAAFAAQAPETSRRHKPFAFWCRKGKVRKTTKTTSDMQIHKQFVPTSWAFFLR